MQLRKGNRRKGNSFVSRLVFSSFRRRRRARARAQIQRNERRKVKFPIGSVSLNQLQIPSRFQFGFAVLRERSFNLGADFVMKWNDCLMQLRLSTDRVEWIVALSANAISLEHLIRIVFRSRRFDSAADVNADQLHARISIAMIVGVAINCGKFRTEMNHSEKCHFADKKTMADSSQIGCSRCRDINSSLSAHSYFSI